MLYAASDGFDFVGGGNEPLICVDEIRIDLNAA